MRRLSFLLAAMLLATAARAELYSWREGGTTRYSNIAPPWYSATESSRVRTRVTLNGILVDDTGLAPEDREKLRAQRAKAEAWNRPGVPVPATAPTAAAAPPAAPAASATPKPPAPPPSGAKPGDLPAPALDGLKKAMESQKDTGALVDQMRVEGRPR